MFRSRDWNAEERQKSKLNKKFNWWNSSKSKIQYKSVLFVTPTPGGILAKELRKREEELNKNCTERIKIEEKGCLKIKDIIGSKNPFNPLLQPPKWRQIHHESRVRKIATHK